MLGIGKRVCIQGISSTHQLLYCKLHVISSFTILVSTNEYFSPNCLHNVASLIVKMKRLFIKYSFEGDIKYSFEGDKASVCKDNMERCFSKFSTRIPNGLQLCVALILIYSPVFYNHV